nr:MAG TPA: hypothetical protein [Caudoviricetes sp.]
MEPVFKKYTINRMTFGRMRLTQRKKKHDFIPLCLWIIYVFSSEQLTACQVNNLRLGVAVSLRVWK